MTDERLAELLEKDDLELTDLNVPNRDALMLAEVQDRIFNWEPSDQESEAGIVFLKDLFKIHRNLVHPSHKRRDALRIHSNIVTAEFDVNVGWTVAVAEEPKPVVIDLETAPAGVDLPVTSLLHTAHSTESHKFVTLLLSELLQKLWQRMRLNRLFASGKIFGHILQNAYNELREQSRGIREWEKGQESREWIAEHPLSEISSLTELKAIISRFVLPSSYIYTRFTDDEE